METIEKKHVEYTYSVKDLSKLMKEFLAEAKDYINENEYQLNSAEAFKQLNHIKWDSYFGNSSKRMKKKFNKAVGRFRHKRSMQSLNRAFHFIHTRLIAKREKVDYRWGSYEKWTNPDFIEKVKVKPSKKHLAIQEKRMKWKEAQAAAEKLRLEYKEEKGDYYKRKGN